MSKRKPNDGNTWPWSTNVAVTFTASSSWTSHGDTRGGGCFVGSFEPAGSGMSCGTKRVCGSGAPLSRMRSLRSVANAA